MVRKQAQTIKYVMVSRCFFEGCLCRARKICVRSSCVAPSVSHFSIWRESFPVSRWFVIGDKMHWAARIMTMIPTISGSCA